MFNTSAQSGTPTPPASAGQPMHRGLPRAAGSAPLAPPSSECRLCGNQNDEVKEQALRTALRKNEAWPRRLAAVSHELRTPLTGIVGFASLLRGPDLSEEQSDLVAQIEECSQTMLAIINDLLDNAMVEAGTVELRTEEFDLHDLARNCLTIMKLAIGQRPVALSLHCDANVPERIIADPLRIRQIILNLLSNAVKFTETGQVDLHLRMRGPQGAEMLKILVADTGAGIEKGHHSRIFEPFEQANMRDMPAEAGTGLGLAICKRLTQLMGGHITLRSTLKRGSMFIVTMPLGALAAPDTRRFKRDLPSLHLPRLLVIQNTQSEQVVTEALMLNFGFRPEFAANGEEATAMAMRSCAEDAPYTAILIDFEHCRDSFNLVKALRNITKAKGRIPVYGIAAGSAKGRAEMCRQTAVDDILTKPLAPSEFAEFARCLMGGAPLEPVPEALMQAGLPGSQQAA